MLENSFGISFFLKSSKKNDKLRYIYLRVVVDGIPKETSTKRKWDISRWDQKIERATGNKEDARALNFFIDSLITQINLYRTELMNNKVSLTSKRIMDMVRGNLTSKAMVLEEFKKHNDEVFSLVPSEYSKGTYDRYVTARSHVREFINYKYKCDDMEFRELDYEFIKDYELYLKTVRNCSNNTTLKYISNFKKIVLRAVAKDIISSDPFKLFKGKKVKTNKKPLTKNELHILESKIFSTERLSVVRDIFVFQCYTGLAYIDVFQLKKTDIKAGSEGDLWIMSNRQKTGSETNIPLLPKAIEIIEKYQDHPDCIVTNRVLPVKSNQKMNEYLKEIAVLCEFDVTLNTHKARRTFGSTVTLNNGVPIHVVKEMLGHHSVKQTEEYALTEQESINREMNTLKNKLSNESPLKTLERIQNEINDFKLKQSNNNESENKLKSLAEQIIQLRELFVQ